MTANSKMDIFATVNGHRAFVIAVMDGRGRCRDNGKMERFRWMLRYAEIKIKDHITLMQLQFGIQHYMNFCNVQKVHSALQYKLADEVYFGTCNWSRQRLY